MWLLFCGMSIDAGIALGIFRHKLTINIKNVLTNIKSEIMIYKKGVNSNPRIPFVTQDSPFVNESPVL